MKNLTKFQLDFLEKSILRGTWHQTSEGEINVNGEVSFSNRKLTAIPVQFGIVMGGFDCSHNKLTSLKGSPYECNEYFACNDNRLTSLEFCTDKIYGHLMCYDNFINTLEFIPSLLSGNLLCSRNAISVDTLLLLFKARYKKNSWEQVLGKNWKKIPLEDRLKLDIPEKFKEKYRGLISASNLGIL